MSENFDLLVSADLLVNDVLGTSLLLARSFGLPEQKKHWLQDFPEEQHQANFMRVHPDRGLAPTALEVIGPHPDTGWEPSLAAANEAQKSRPMKTHNTVVGVSDTDAVLQRLQENSVPHVVDPGSGERPFTRIWIGTENLAAHEGYDPQYDAGLRVEILPTAVLQLPAEPTTEQVQPGAAIRIVSRSFIVEDLHRATTALSRTLGWRAGAMRSLVNFDAVAVSYSGSMRNGASIELLQATEDNGIVGIHGHKYGPGAYRITLGVNGLDAAAARLLDTGIGFQDLGAAATQRRSLRIDSEALDGIVVDLVDATI